MKVILSQDIPNLGEEGDILKVSPGYARNFLIPKNLAYLHNKSGLAILESRKKVIEGRKQQKLDAAKSTKEQIEGTTLEFTVTAGESGRLFGSITSQMISEALANKNIEVERRMIDIPGHTIKVLGNYTVQVRLYGKEQANLAIKVLREGAQEEEQPSETKPDEPQVEASPEAVTSPSDVAKASEDSQASADAGDTQAVTSPSDAATARASEDSQASADLGDAEART